MGINNSEIYLDKIPQTEETGARDMLKNDRRKRSNHLPRLAEFLLYCFLSKKERDVFIRDLEKDFSSVILPKFGLRRARFWYWSQVFSSIALPLTRHVVKLLSLSWVLDRARRWMQG